MAVVTPRDEDLFRALDRTPLTLRQLLTLSETYRVPFPSYRLLHARLQRLLSAGWVRRFWYPTVGRQAESYYTLSPIGFALLHGHKAPLPSRQRFGPVGDARCHHTKSLADVLVHAQVAARRGRILFSDFHRENTLRLVVDGKSLFPDCAFTLLAPGCGPLKFFVELDNGTEPMTSPRERDSWERKIRLYEALQDRSGERFRVLGIVTRSAERLQHLLAIAAAAARNPQRSLVYGSTLSAYLAEKDPLAARCFLDHRGTAVALVPPPRLSPRPAAPATSTALVETAGG